MSFGEQSKRNKYFEPVQLLLVTASLITFTYQYAEIALNHLLVQWPASSVCPTLYLIFSFLFSVLRSV